MEEEASRSGNMIVTPLSLFNLCEKLFIDDVVHVTFDFVKWMN
jgi:hypothetical protein